jgi:hypothetical protein
MIKIYKCYLKHFSIWWTINETQGKYFGFMECYIRSVISFATVGYFV